MNLSKGFHNIISPTLTNLLIALSLVIIVILVYINNKKIDLFDESTDYLNSIIAKYQANKTQSNNFSISLATQEQKIQDLYTKFDSIYNYV